VRELFLLDPDVVYLNHGSFGACPRTVFERYQALQLELECEPVAFIARMLPTLPPFDLPTQLQETDLSGLNSRQRKALEYVRQHGSITRAEYVNLFGVSERQASRDLTELVEGNILTRQGRTTSAQYTLPGKPDGMP